MLDKIEHVIEMLLNAKKDKKTYVLSVGCLVAFGVAVGAVAVYESMLNELDEQQGIRPYKHRATGYSHRYEEDEDEDDY